VSLGLRGPPIPWASFGKGSKMAMFVIGLVVVAFMCAACLILDFG